MGYQLKQTDKTWVIQEFLRTGQIFIVATYKRKDAAIKRFQKLQESYQTEIGHETKP